PPTHARSCVMSPRSTSSAPAPPVTGAPAAPARPCTVDRASYVYCHRWRPIAVVGAGKENSMRIMGSRWQADPRALTLRVTGTALELLLVALLTATVASAQTADLAVTQSSTPNPAMAGDVVNVTITVTNNGPSAATDGAM